VEIGVLEGAAEIQGFEQRVASQRGDACWKSTAPDC